MQLENRLPASTGAAPRADWLTVVGTGVLVAALTAFGLEAPLVDPVTPAPAVVQPAVR